MLFALEDTICACFVQLRSSLIRIPIFRLLDMRQHYTLSMVMVYSFCSLFLSTLAMVMMTHFDGLNRIHQVEAQRPSCFVVGSSGLLRILWCGITDNQRRKGNLVMSHVQEDH